mgnify:CR=1 FL=1
MPPIPVPPRTLAAQAMGHIDEKSRGVVPPIHVTTTFLRDPDNQYRTGNVYGRPDNETVREAEAIIAMLEDAKAAIVLGSGMGGMTCAAILARRNRFIAVALSGLATGVGCAPQTCLKVIAPQDPGAQRPARPEGMP